MPEWMQKDEIYSPETDKNGFIEKSILSILGVLSRIKSQEIEANQLYRVDPLLKVVLTFLLVILLSLSNSFSFIIVVSVYLLVVLSLLDAEIIIRIFRISTIVALFTFIMLVPALILGSGGNIIMLTGKVFTTVAAINILSRTTKWNEITGALSFFHVPDLFILVLDIAIKYILMLGEYALSMLYSLKMRSVGKNRRKYTSLSGIAGTMFLKSREMAEDMYSAMECRGFTGEYKSHRSFRLALADYGFILANIGIAMAFFYLERV
ncbi:MAG: energy-coupling factor transporter transmembrane component T [Clostridiaceae bacterium]